MAFKGEQACDSFAFCLWLETKIASRRKNLLTLKWVQFLFFNRFRRRKGVGDWQVNPVTLHESTTGLTVKTNVLTKNRNTETSTLNSRTIPLNGVYVIIKMVLCTLIKGWALIWFFKNLGINYFFLAALWSKQVTFALIFLYIRKSF